MRKKVKVGGSVFLQTCLCRGLQAMWATVERPMTLGRLSLILNPLDLKARTIIQI